MALGGTRLSFLPLWHCCRSFCKEATYLHIGVVGSLIGGGKPDGVALLRVQHGPGVCGGSVVHFVGGGTLVRRIHLSWLRLWLWLWLRVLLAIRLFDKSVQVQNIGERYSARKNHSFSKLWNNLVDLSQLARSTYKIRGKQCWLDRLVRPRLEESAKRETQILVWSRSLSGREGRNSPRKWRKN